MHELNLDGFYKNHDDVRATFQKYFLLIATVFVILVFGSFEQSFFKISNLMDIISSASVLGILGTGLTCVMITGELDFAFFTEMSAGAVLMALIMAIPGFNNYYLGLFIVFVLLILFGLLNSFVHIWVGIPSFIATLATSALVNGILKSLSNGQNLYSTRWPKCFTFIGQGYVFDIIPVPVILLIFISIFSYAFIEKTKTGKYLYALGSNPVASKFVGINVKKQKMIAFLLCSVLCGFAGILQGSMVNSASVYMGEAMLTNGISCIMLGGTFLRPGTINVPGTIVAAILLSVIANGLTMVGASAFMKDLIQGAILLLAVGTIVIIKK